jgi:DNA-binding SARP family transcriptional activator/tetratricopeptide (TPR) repeat protein
MDLTILGPTRLVVRGQTIDLSTRQRALLTLLLLRVGQQVPVSQVIELIWGGAAPAGVQKRLYEVASRLRNVLHVHHVPGRLDREGNAYRLTLDPTLVDFHRLRLLTRDAQVALSRQDDRTAEAVLIRAAGLWQGEPLADLGGERADRLRRQVLDTVLATHLLLFDVQRRHGRHQAILDRLAPLIEDHRENDALAKHWMLALAECGREEEARAFFSALRQHLRHELDTEPSPELLAIYRRLPSHHAGGPHGTAVTRPEPLPRGPFPRDIDDFVGRTAELSRLDGYAAGPGGGSTGAVVLDGLPGSGKTRLAVRWVYQHIHTFPDGRFYLDGGGYGPSAPLEPADVVGRLLDMLGTPADRIATDLVRRQARLAEALAGRHAVLLLDNVCDAAQVRPVLNAVEDCFLIIISRARQPGLAIQDGVSGITVEPFDQAESEAFLRRSIGTDRAALEPEQLAALAARSGGLPFALRVIAQHAVERPRARIAELDDQLRLNLLTRGGHGTSDDASLLTLFRHYYATLPDDVARTFRLLGLHPSTRINIAAVAALRDGTIEDTEVLIDALARWHFVEHDEDRQYVTIHDVSWGCARDRVEAMEPPEQQAAARRRLLDFALLTACRAAAVLAPHRDPVPGVVDDGSVRPLAFPTEAAALAWCADERRGLLALTRLAAESRCYRHGWQIPAALHEILERFGRQDDVLTGQQIALGCAEALNDQEAVLGTRNNTGITYLALRRYREAIAEFESALRLARELGHPDDEARSIHNLATTYLRKGSVPTSVDLFRRALRICREIGDAAGEAHTTYQLGTAYRKMGKHDQAVLYSEAALTLRQQLGSIRGQGLSHAELAKLYLACGQRALAARHCEQALEIHAQTRDELRMSAALVTAVRIDLELGLIDDALNHARRAVEISAAARDSHHRARAAMVLGDALAASGSTELAHGSWRQALTIFKDIDRMSTESP